MPISARLVLGLTAASLFTAGWAAIPAQDKAPEIKIHPVAGTVSMLEGEGGNIGVCAGPEGALMIDDQYARMAPKIQVALATLTKEPLRFLINTHWHGDHTGGNETFGALVPIVAHKNVRERMSKPSAGRGGDKPASPPKALPVLTFEDSVTLHCNGEEIVVHHVAPAHTDGDSIIWFKTSNVVHLGDLWFNGRFPFIDQDSGGSVRGLTKDIADLLATLPKDAKLIPGHGPLGTLEELRSYHAMLVDTQKLVADALAAGKDARAMKKDNLLAKYSSWNWEFIKADTFIDMLVREEEAK
ncbi:MAG TPA: MBL fold metallo-hydrolase [Planctomycetota bacterium]|nr:MBL fold metallo-hydrolase [Planctomycetota bacterium]